LDLAVLLEQEHRQLRLKEVIQYLVLLLLQAVEPANIIIKHSILQYIVVAQAAAHFGILEQLELVIRLVQAQVKETTVAQQAVVAQLRQVLVAEEVAQ
jgi:hypothetical protein